MKKHIVVFVICAVFLLSLAGCHARFNEAAFVGNTSATIVSKFGPFDYTAMPAGEDGLYRNCQCGYTAKEPQKGLLGTSAEILFLITFDENGTATKFAYGYRPGG